MKFIDLIKKSKMEIEGVNDFPFLDFQKGAEWMANQVGQPYDSTINYHFYGYLKYGISFLGMGLALFILGQIHFLLLPFAILVFYYFEVQFAFLFLLLIEKDEQPLISSIKVSNQFGIWKLIMIILPLGFYMMIGLFKTKRPYENWYLGCMSVILLYQDEVKNRK